MVCKRTRVVRRRGKIGLLALIFLVFMVVLMGLLGNSGHVVNQKLRNQNAVDAIAFSSSMWLARGMNTITASNHLVGELSAIVVIHESLGGRELTLGLKKNTQENRQLDTVLRSLKLTAPIGRIPSPYVPPTATSIDRKVIDFVINRTSPNGNRQLEAFATIYDSRLTLKRELAGWLTAKSIANLGFLVPPPFGYATAIGAYAVHITASVNIALIGKEWLLLEVLERYAFAAAPIGERVINQQLVPTLNDFASKVAGVSLEQADEAGLAIESAVVSVEKISNAHQVEGDIYPNEELRLPVVFEPLPSMQGKQGAWPKGWGDDKAIALPDIDQALGDMESRLNRALNKIAKRVSALDRSLDELKELRESVAERSQGVEGEDKQLFEDELEELDTLIAAIEKQMLQLAAQAQEIASERDAQKDLMASVAAGESQNLSLEHLPERMDPNEERTSQWARALYPNLDTMRAPLLGLMEAQLKKSHASKHFTKWTNRYALVYGWQFRSGQRLEKTGIDSARWRKTSEPKAMLVLKGSYQGRESRKGRESWIGSASDQQLEAEELFTLLATSHRDLEAIFSPSIFAVPNSNGITSIAQSIVYNANPQQAAGSAPDQQAVAGWDTLNWIPSAHAQEWGADPSKESAQWPWEILDSLRNKKLVKLNWQPKLVPITETRIEQALIASDSEVREALELARDYMSLISH